LFRLFSVSTFIVAAKFPQLIKSPKKYPSNGDFHRMKGEKQLIKNETFCKLFRQSAKKHRTYHGTL